MSIVAGCTTCSFNHIAVLLSKYIKKYYNLDIRVTHRIDAVTRLIVTDMWWTLIDGIKAIPPRDAVYWIDSFATRVKVPLNINRINRYLTTSEWNRIILDHYGIKAQVLPRSFNDDMTLKWFNTGQRSIDVMVIATDYERKNVKVIMKAIRELGIKKYVAICKGEGCTHEPYSVSEDQKYEMLARSKLFVWLSDSEGFGLPPIEAMSVGTPVIYSDNPFVSHNIIYETNIAVPCKLEEVEDEIAIRPKSVFNLEDVKNAIKEGLRREITPEEREKMREFTWNRYSHKKVLEELVTLDILRP